MDIIAAIATAQGAAGVAIVRLSGENCLNIAKKMFSRKGEYVPNMLYPGTIDCGAFSDYGMCVWFRAPRSFTGEDSVEFHCHGGVEIARGVLAQAISLGARQAERGEFTRRAFLNGKLSLSAAEGMAEMIGAQSQAQVRAGYLLLSEKLTGEAARLQGLVRECLAGIDADVDYPEEDLAAETAEHTERTLLALRTALLALKGQYRAGKKIRAGVRVAICGKPNAGKSSLLNALLGYDRAIVSAEAGTTRDIVEGTIEIGGVLFHLTDTAGLRESDNAIEREGIRRAENAIRAADVVLWLEEGQPPLLPTDAPVIRVASKCDLKRREGDVQVSSVTGEGLEQLKELMYARGFGVQNDGAYLMEERHYESVCAALGATEDALAAIAAGRPSELYAEDLRRVYTSLGEISGETANESIIEEIFSKFCVGK